MSDEDITHVTVKEKCSHCKGAGRVPGGQRKYGELVPCGVCNGSGLTPKTITIDRFIDIISKRMEKKNAERRPS